MSDNASSTVIRRADYTPPAFLIDSVELEFELAPARTIVRNTMRVRRNPDATYTPHLELMGEALEFIGAWYDGARCTAVRAHEHGLTVENVPDAFALTIESACAPDQNTTLSGLYVSSGNFFTQCEAEGFRRITYFLDRPDVMASYTVTLCADKAAYPVLLSNGNLIASGDLPDGRHYAKWQDPFRKPSYLFALVAGKLVALEEKITTGSGKEKLLQVWVEPHDLDKTRHAMDSLIHSIRWDESRFGLELDLDRFMIVAVGDFNMGAMENKGLNIFNTKYVLANPETATDTDFANIESVVGHEYFHNWTGNRVTCRDWFQLSLKEGLTVFRDQEFSMDMMSGGDPASAARAVKRIDDVRTLRAVQFPEDAGPMSHPIRPDEYEEINNFYTATVYEKGAEVVRMQQTILGREGFRRGMDEYFRRHDGQAVTCDDFVAAMEAANGADLGQFREWYAQSGTPRLRARFAYDAAGKRFTLTLAQSNGAGRKPLHIPVAVGLVGPDGRDLTLQLEGEAAPQGTTRVLHLKAAEQGFVFVNVASAPVPSVLRDFSAPVQLAIDLSDEQLAFLMANDSDAFNRWEAGQ
ncbi:MAG TPA: aminopeptidase N, partial [Casimicrobiaceae bacterium]|nr:aminopeptidase N [Casimicrobiaceae bacterium]